MSELRNCLRHNKLEQCVKVGVGFARFIHPELDWMCREALDSIEAWKHPKPIIKWQEWEREFQMDYNNDD